MHIPDGFLSTPAWVALDAAAIPAVGWITRRAQSEVEESRIPLLGVRGAFVFAAQMINFPVAPGTSNHLVGGALLAFALGPWDASLVMVAIHGFPDLCYAKWHQLLRGFPELPVDEIGCDAAHQRE